jgi:hypothetical protein
MPEILLTLTALLVLLSVAGWGLEWPRSVMTGLLCALVILLVWAWSGVLQQAARLPRSQAESHPWVMRDWPRRDTQPAASLWERARSAERGSGILGCFVGEDKGNLGKVGSDGFLNLGGFPCSKAFDKPGMRF